MTRKTFSVTVVQMIMVMEGRKEMTIQLMTLVVIVTLEKMGNKLLCLRPTENQQNG